MSTSTTFIDLIDAGYAASTPPNGDFLAVQMTRRVEEAELAPLRVVARETGLRCSTLANDSIILAPVATLDKDHTFVSGFGFLPSGEAISGPRNYETEALTPLSQATGNFTSVSWCGGAFEAETDYFGMGRIFSFQWGGGALVSNRLHLAALAISRLGLAIEIDSEHIVSLVLEHPFFVAQPFTGRTPIRGLTRAEIGTLCRIAGGRLQIERVNDLASPPGASYDELLEGAREEITAHARSISRLFGGKPVVADLSGGLDSRLAIAPFLEVPGSLHGVRTHDVTGSDDLRISAIIAARYKLPYVQARAGERYEIDASQSLTMWRSFMVGEYNALGALSSVLARADDPVGAVGANVDFVRSTGSAGEITRGFWSKALAHLLDEHKPESMTEFVEVLLRHKTPMISRVSVGRAEELRGYVRGSVEPFEGMELREALIWHYIHHRNRAHFGMRELSNAVDAIYAMPLLSRNLFDAAKLLTIDQRDEGKAIRDLIKLFDPRLAEVPYDGDSLDGWCTPEVEAKLNEWGASSESALKRATVQRRNADAGSSGRIDLPSKQRSVPVAVAQAAMNLSEAYPDYADIFTLVAHVFRAKFKAWPREANYLASRLFGVEDVLLPSVGSSRRSPAVDARVANYLDPIKSITVDFQEPLPVARIELFEDCSQIKYEYAFDVKSESERLASRWYTSDPTWSDESLTHGGVRLIGYARPVGSQAVFSVNLPLEGRTG